MTASFLLLAFLSCARPGAAQTRPAGWFSPQQPPAGIVPAGPEAERQIEAQRAARAGGRLYFLVAGRILVADPGTGQPAFVEDSRGTRAVLAYKDSLVALGEDGSVRLYDGKRWIQLGGGMSRLVVAGEELLALDRGGAISVYAGAPGPLVITWLVFPTADGGMTLMPLVDGRAPAFTGTGLKGVAALDPEPDRPGEARVRFADGRVEPYRRPERPARP